MKSTDQKSCQRVRLQIWSILLWDSLTVSHLTSHPHPYGYKAYFYGGFERGGWGRGPDPLYLWPVKVQSRGITQKKRARERGQMIGWADSNGWVKRTSEVRSSRNRRDVINNSSDTLHRDTVSVLPHQHSDQRRLCHSAPKEESCDKCWEKEKKSRESTLDYSGWMRKTSTMRRRWLITSYTLRKVHKNTAQCMMELFTYWKIMHCIV